MSFAIRWSRDFDNWRWVHLELRLLLRPEFCLPLDWVFHISSICFQWDLQHNFSLLWCLKLERWLLMPVYVSWWSKSCNWIKYLASMISTRVFLLCQQSKLTSDLKSQCYVSFCCILPKSQPIFFVSQESQIQYLYR